MAQTTVTFIGDFSSLQNGFKQLNEGMGRVQGSAQKFGQILSTVSDGAGTAGRAFGALAGALASGSVFGLAAAAIQLMVDAFRESSAEAEKFNTELKKIATDGAKRVKDISDEITRLVLATRGLSSTQIGFKLQEDSARAEVTRWTAAVRSLREEVAEAATDGQRGELQKQLTYAEAQLRVAQDIADALQVQAAAQAELNRAEQAGVAGKNLSKVTNDGLKTAGTAAQARLDAEKYIQDKLKNMEEQAAQERIQVEIEAAKASGDAWRVLGLEAMLSVRKIMAEWAQAIKELKAHGATEADFKKLEESMNSRLGSIGDQDMLKAEALDKKESGSEVFGPGSPLGEAEFQIATESQKKIRDEVEKTAAAYQQWGQIAGDAIGGLITGQKSLGQTLAEIGQMIISQVVQIAIKSITANAASAAAGAASSQAGIPVVGPVLAISAMGAMLTAVMGLLGNVGSAAGGWDLPGGGPFPAVLHAKEMVLPAQYAERIRNMTEGSGGNTYVINALDTKSFYSALKNNDKSLIKVLVEATADGRY